MVIVQTLVTFAIAGAGAFVGVRLKIPAGGMVGAMLAVMVFSIASDQAYFPADVKTVVQMISGLFIGCKITRKEVLELKKAFRPAVVNTLLLLPACMGIGLVLYFVTDYSIATCALSTAPGGIVDMSVISFDMDADPTVVSVLQLVRVLSILCLFPTLFRVIIQKVQKKAPPADDAAPPETADAPPAPEQAAPTHRTRNILLTFLVAGVSGFAGYALGIPAGTLVFSMTGVTLLNVLTGAAYMPNRVKLFAQVCAGSLIGSGVTRASVMGLRSVLVPALAMVVVLVAISLALAFILYRTSDLDFATALFSCAPGGAGDLALIAEEFGANTPKISVVQYMRLISVIALYPPIIQWMAGVLP